MRNIMLTIFFSLSIFTPLTHVDADDHRLNQLYIHAYIHENGSATISEYRHAYLTEGTENYDVIENLGESEIFNFEVRENDIWYEYVRNWDIDASREEKTFKNSILKTDDGYELVWGIGEYGEHEYEIRYVVTNFIKQLKDSQILFWRFINDETNIPPQEVVIVIETEDPLSNETEKIWGFGFEGEVIFDDGMVIAYNEEPFDDSTYATILIQFSDGKFETKDILDKSFAEVQDEAFDGSDYGKRDDSLTKGEIAMIFIIPIMVFTGPVIVVIVAIRKKLKESRRLRAIKESYEGQYSRDLPYHRNFTEVFFILQEDRIAIFDQLINAYLLKWIKEKRVSFVKNNKKGLFSSRKKALQLHRIDDVDHIEEEYERRLFELLIEAADEKGRLIQGEQWSKPLQEKFGDWKKTVSDYSRDQLLAKGYIRKEVIHEFSEDVYKYEVTDEGKPLQAEIYRFINYLEDFSLVEEREAFEVTIWDNLLMWAALLNLVPVIQEQFNKIYANYLYESVYAKDTLETSRILARHINYYANYSQYNSGEQVSLGGGGSTSIGGGGGSFGGGSGGGTR